MALASFTAKLYFLTTGTRASWGAADSSGRASGSAPSLTEVPNVRDILIPIEKNKADITQRLHGGWKAYKGTLRDAEISIPQVYNPLDTGYLALLKAFLLGKTIALALLDGDKATDGTEGLWGDFEVVGCEKGEKLDDAQMVTWKVVPGDTQVPNEWVIVAS